MSGGKNLSISAALRLRIKAMLDAGLSPAEVAERLAGTTDTDAFPLVAEVVEESIEAVAAEGSGESPTPIMVLEAPPPEETSRPSAAAEDAPEPALYNDVSRLFSLLDLVTSGDGPGTVVQFIGSHRREGTSTIAREFARICAVHSDRPTLLLDLDLARDAQFETFSKRAAKMPSEGVGRAVSLGIDLGKLVRLDKEIPALPASETLITVHRIGETSLHVTRINPLVRAQGVVPQVTRAPDCWEQVRRKTTLTIVDSPPLTDSFDGLAVSGLVDRVVVIMEAESTRLPVVSELCDRLTQQQAPIAGVVFNKRRFYIPRFIYRWL